MVGKQRMKQDNLSSLQEKRDKKLPQQKSIDFFVSLYFYLILNFFVKNNNKIQLMRQMQQIKGYGKQEIAHLNPVNSIKQLQQKSPQHYTLIEKCLKSLVRQKLSGCLINIQRKKRQNQQRSQSNKKIFDKSYEDLDKYLNGSIKKRSNANPELKSFFPDQNSSNQTRNPSTMMSINERISKMSKKNRDRYRAINQTQPILQKMKQDLNLYRLSEVKKRPDLSFISSVQIQQEQRQRKKSLNIKNQDKNLYGSENRLPKLENRISISISPSTIIKNIRKPSNYNINQQFWTYLMNQNDVPFRKRKSSTTSDTNILISLNQAAKQVKSSLFKPSIPSVSRDNLQAYINSLPLPFKRLIQFVISFFNIKIQNEVTALFYSKMLDELNVANNRAWCVIGFIFWDFNRDGTINSKDLFHIFKQFNQFQQNQTYLQKNKKIQKNDNQRQLRQQSRQKKDEENEKNEKNEKKLRIHRKQNQIHIEIQSNIKEMQRALKKFKPEFEKQKQKQKKIKQKQKQAQQYKNFQNAKLSVNDLNKKPSIKLQNVQKAISIFKQQLLRLNSRISTSTYSHIDAQQLMQPEQKLISYLQQIVLTQPNLKYEEIEPLFSAGGNNNDNHQHKLQLFPKDLKVKCSSSYRQCFVSTQHNQQTRLLRQKIQYYKLKLKEKRMNKNTILQQKIAKNLKLQKQLNYVKVAQSSMGQVVKDILFNLLGYEQ